MSKEGGIPAEALLDQRRRPDELSPRHPGRRAFVEGAAGLFGVSPSMVYRALAGRGGSRRGRGQYRIPRVAKPFGLDEEMINEPSEYATNGGNEDGPGPPEAVAHFGSSEREIEASHGARRQTVPTSPSLCVKSAASFRLEAG